MSNFSVCVLNDAGLAHVMALSDEFESLSQYIGEILHDQPSRLRSLVDTKLQEAYLIAREAVGQVPGYRHAVIGHEVQS